MSAAAAAATATAAAITGAVCRVLFLSFPCLPRLPSLRATSHAENCIFHVAHAPAVTCMQIFGT